MFDWSHCPAVERAPGKVSGEWLFRTTRVPVRALFENLEGGASVLEFLEWFPGVTREQADAVLEHASQSLAVPAWGYLKVLFDQGTPAPLRRAFDGHIVETAYERGWGELENGRLVQMAESLGFDVLVTTDKNLRYQQNLDGRRIAICVLWTTSWPQIREHSGRVARAVCALDPGAFHEFARPA